MLVADSDKIALHTFSADQSFDWEQSMLGNFDLELSKAQRVITWNGFSFDVPLLMLRALKHCVPMRSLESNWGYRFRDYHYDMKDRLGQYGFKQDIRLEGVARLLGLPGKQDIDGSQVKDCWERSEYARVREYCESDVIQTYLIYLRYVQVLYGYDTAEMYQRVYDQWVKKDLGYRTEP